ncbi:MAG: arginine decarboxylase [Chitinophagales bacterium]|nr:arginine decarboxylase [Chitinophagales bacterium]
MSNRYSDLVHQTFDFPQDGFKVRDNRLFFHDIDILEITKKYGTPLKLTYLPKISDQIQSAKKMFAKAFKQHKYEAEYNYCYCTKSSHFNFILEEALKNDIHLETSFAFDLEIIMRLYRRKKINKQTKIVSNGYKTKAYTRRLSQMINEGFNVTPILDNKEEFKDYDKMVKTKCNIGIRIAAEEEPQFQFYTSRLGIRSKDIVNFYLAKIKDNDRFDLKMLHFFINTGIKDDAYYWSELNKALDVYCNLRKECETLDSINIGGGFPIRNSLNFTYDYDYMINEIVLQIKNACKRAKVPVPHIYTEFGSFTVGESGAAVYSVLDQKLQNDNELWYMIDSSFITTLPDTWGIGQKFIMLPINKWEEEYHRVNLGGLTCDSHDYYNSEANIAQIYLPKISKTEPLFIGFFHTGAYQESLSGYGGIKHCLVPAPKHVLIDRDEEGKITTRLFRKEQTADSMMRILGY